MSITGKLFRILMVDRTAKHKTMAQLSTELHASQQTIADQIHTADDTPQNREQLCHVIGIERWAQTRLQTALGGPVKTDEYDGYRPSAETTWSELSAEFDQTRLQTLQLVNQLVSQPAIEIKMINHNDMGQMSIKSWLQYIEMHAPYELRNVK